MSALVELLASKNAFYKSSTNERPRSRRFATLFASTPATSGDNVNDTSQAEDTDEAAEAREQERQHLLHLVDKFWFDCEMIFFGQIKQFVHKLQFCLGNEEDQTGLAWSWTIGKNPLASMTS